MTLNKTIQVSSPRDASLAGIYRETDIEELKKKLQQQRQQIYTWSERPLVERLQFLKKIRKSFFEKSSALVKVIQNESGKVLPEIYGAEIIANLELFDFYLKQSASILKDEKVSINPLNYPGKKGFVQHRPLGIVGVLSSWNYPVALPLRAIIPALIAGNGIVFKPSVDASLSGQIIARIFEENLPAQVFVSAFGGRVVSETIIDHVDKINFIGSVATGKAIAARCSGRLIPYSMELSGKDAAIVLDDCDFERTLNGVIWGAFTNSGQNCASIERLYVHESLYDRFVPELVRRVAQLKQDRDYGPLKNEKQMGLVTQHVQNAIQTGSKILLGGNRIGESLYFEPTVIDVKDRQASFMVEETFGPTLPIVKVKNLEEAIQETNSAKFGLTTSVWTSDIEKAKAVASRLESGVVMINNCVFTGALAGAPWGGMKDTGHGVTNSKYGLLEMTRPHFLLIDRSKAKKETWWYPYSDDLTTLMKTVTETLGGKFSAYLKIPNLLKKVSKKYFD